MNGNNHKGPGSDPEIPEALQDSNKEEKRQPLKLTFSISLSSLKRKKEQQDLEEQQLASKAADNDSNINTNTDDADALTNNGDIQDSPEVKNEPEVEENAGSNDASKEYKEDLEMQDASEEPEKAMNSYNNDSYSNTESDSNVNMKEDEESNSMADMSQEENLSQDGFDEDKPDARNRRTRSASIDDRDITDKSSSQDEAVSIVTTKGGIMGGIDTRKKDESQDSMEKSSRSAAAAERELFGFREPVTAAAPTTSFLDSLSEEQRRVRTRHLPDVAGFRRLHKSEIKRDMALVRRMLKASKSAGGNKKAPAMDDETSNNADAEKMEISGAGASEDESQSDDENQMSSKSKAGRGHISDLDVSSVLENPQLPNIFSLPFTESPYICTDVEGKLPTSNSQPSLFSSPQVVESITAFNPPRPPESVGPKKMHRLNRWERNPQDVEVDLSNYRKTVERTRQELQKAEYEREKIELVGQHIRAHYMSQLQCMRHEMDLLNECYEATQTQCIKAADLLTSKTRSRGVARGSNVMKDVLSVLKSRGTDNSSSINGDGKASCSLGIGGISETPDSKLASGWILPGDKVLTPYGKGIVADAYGPCILDTSVSSKKSLKTDEQPQSQETIERSRTPSSTGVVLPPRVCVKLGFGQGYFCPMNLKSLEKISKYSDDQLGKRWMSMIETAQLAKTCVDVDAVDHYDANHQPIVTSSNESEDAVMEEIENSEGMNMLGCNGKKSADKTKLLPYGSSLFPSSSCRGGGLESMSIDQVEKNISNMLDQSAGVLGVVSFE